MPFEINIPDLDLRLPHPFTTASPGVDIEALGAELRLKEKHQ